MKIWQIAPTAAMMNSIAEFFIRHGVALLWRRIDVAVFRTLPRSPENCMKRP
jgi:hypothetical protein